MGGLVVVIWINQGSCSYSGRHYKSWVSIVPQSIIGGRKILDISNIAQCMCIFQMMIPDLIGAWRK